MKTSTSVKKRKKGRLSRYEAYLWLAPCLVLVTIFVFVPVIETFVLSVSEVSRAGLVKGFGGLRNFQFVLGQPVFGRVILNTVVWTIVNVGVSMVLSIITALVLNEKFHGRKLARTVLLLPWATSQMITASAWKYIFDYQYGALNALLLKLGLIKTNINFLGSANSAFICMIVVGITVTIPFMTFTLLSGLQSISTDFYEAATIDGANFWDKLFRITLPLLKPAINVTIVLNTIYVFNNFTIVFTITNGAPANQTSTMMVYLYYLAFKKGDYGASAAISVIGFVILLAFALLYMKYQMKEETAS